MGKLVVVTGASSGFGESIAKAFSSKGYSLLLLARRVERMEALNLPNSICRKVDVRDLDALKVALKEAETKFGPADLLVNNAGIMMLDSVDRQNVSEWYDMIDVNIKGVLNGINAVVSGMKERGRGTIINISSVAGRALYDSHTVYCGTKFAVHAISEGLRKEVADFGVRVTTIAPGAAQTELLGHTTADSIKADYEKWKDSMGGIMSAEDVARSVVFVYDQPQSLCIREIALASTKQSN